MSFKLPNQNNKVRKGNFNLGGETAAPGVPLIRKKLEEGVQAEANDDGSIFIDESVVAGSDEERLILSHEMKHLTDMKIGKLKYDDESITWNGNKHPRKDGKILYDGEWVPEGGKEFPWEKH
tara:strand:+ start:387 stop:752 length:366 start_codon:yes stop_codon:yes gene_type:complete